MLQPHEVAITMEDNETNPWGIQVDFGAAPWEVVDVEPGRQAAHRGMKPHWQLIRWNGVDIRITDPRTRMLIEENLSAGASATITFDKVNHLYTSLKKKIKKLKFSVFKIVPQKKKYQKKLGFVFASGKTIGKLKK